MTHRCNVQCYTMESQKSELLGIGIEDDGKWMPFVFTMEMVRAIKLTSDDRESSTYNCTTLFTHEGDTYVIDTPFEKFAKMFIDYVSLFDLDSEEDDNDDNDLNL